MLLPTLLACGMVLAGAVVVNQSAVHWRSNLPDSLLFGYYGWCIADGARPYLDVWDNKPPGIWWINAAAFGLCGPGLGGDLLLGSLALGAMLLAFVAAARTVYHRSVLLPAGLVGAVLLTDLRFECGSNRTETFVCACETVAVLCYLRWLRRRRYAWLVLAGLAAGTSPLFKQSGLAAAAACGLHLAWVQWSRPASGRGLGKAPARWQPWLIAGGALAVAPLTAAGVLAHQGALSEAVFAVGRFNQAYFAVGDATWVHIDRALRVYQPVLTLLRNVFLVAGAGLVWGLAVCVRRGLSGVRHPPPRRGVGLFLLWFLLAAYLACVGPGRRGYHFMPALPALGLLGLYALHLLAGRRGLRTRLTAHPGAAAALVAAAYWLGALAVGNLHAAGEVWQTKPQWYAVRSRWPAPYQLQAAEICRLTGPGDTIYVWGWSPGTYRFAYRRAASRYATIEKIGHVGAQARFIVDGAVADIRRTPPTVFVISVNDYAALRAPPPSNFAVWLSRHYETAHTVAGMHILTRRLDKTVLPR